MLGFGGQLFVMLSSGGIGTIETATRFPIRLLESGPAAGALATAYFGAMIGAADLMSFDMGGTTAKLCVVEKGQPLTANDFEVDRKYRFKKGSGLPVKTPVIEMIEIGAGGGSIARIDALGLLKVGPDSAGAEPGPACYGRGGTEPTVTDADLILGYLDPGLLPGRPDAARPGGDRAGDQGADRRPARPERCRGGLGHPPGGQREHGERRPGPRHRARQGRRARSRSSRSAGPGRSTPTGSPRSCTRRR